MKLIVAVLALAFTVSAQASTFKCFGTEPFWSAAVNTEKAVTTVQLAGEKSNTYSTPIVQAEGTSGNFAFLAKGETVRLTVVTDKSCSDGMSDKTYTHAAVLTGVGQSVLYGCCAE